MLGAATPGLEALLDAAPYITPLYNYNTTASACVVSEQVLMGSDGCTDCPADVYSFAIVVSELLSRAIPFQQHTFSGAPHLREMVIRCIILWQPRKC